MSYFVNVGVFKSNENRPGARGYHIQRVGRELRVTWGAIDWRWKQLPNGRIKEYFWFGRTFWKPHRFKSVAAAISARRALEHRRVYKEGYQRLPAYHWIAKTARSHPSRRKD